jgi:CYTH domain-containing protein
MIAEVEAPTMADLESLRCPAWALREVTDDPAFSAITLARRQG